MRPSENVTVLLEASIFTILPPRSSFCADAMPAPSSSPAAANPAIRCIVVLLSEGFAAGRPRRARCAIEVPWEVSPRSAGADLVVACDGANARGVVALRARTYGVVRTWPRKAYRGREQRT